MPLGWERINSKRSAPNKNIVFIKPRPGKDEAISKDFLEQIAAQCLPIMNEHSLAVLSLEEYEPNLEFWGRNFNHGEVIQLVLKSPSTGRWLPFRFVQMVMMHELAHNKQMNHSKAFWAVRNEFSAEMKGLWERGYTGDGLWGRGVLLENGQFSHEILGEDEILPVHMCGGGFVSRRSQKRRIKPKITFKEAKERRIRKKFGENGTALGGDEVAKSKLENGKRPIGKPRVAGSKRGRDLRAAAALARFEPVKKEPEIKNEDVITDSETESDMGDVVFIKTELNDAVDINGERMLDSDGQGLVKVCEDEDKNDEDVKNEFLDFQAVIDPHALPLKPYQAKHFNSRTIPKIKREHLKDTDTMDLSNKESSSGAQSETPKNLAPVSQDDIPTASKDEEDNTTVVFQQQHTKQTRSDSAFMPESHKLAAPHTSLSLTGKFIQPAVTIVEHSCMVCSVENEATALTCIVCSNVLKPDFVPNIWRCKNPICKDSVYLNSGDVALCGICGNRKSFV